MTEPALVAKTEQYVKGRFTGEASGHDWWHIYRVWQLSKHIASSEAGADLLVVELAALLHDIADWKFTDEVDAGPKATRKWLESLKASEEVILKVEDIVRHISFKGANVKSELTTIEGFIVHDADKLDAIGAIGIARAFAFGGAAGRIMYDPSRKPVMHTSFESYKSDKTGTINHFYDKLLLLKDRMFTVTGKEMALARHEFMENYLKQFYSEWEGNI